MKNIDFSCKHNVWLRNEDGSLSRMDEPYFRSMQVRPDTWQILSDGDYSYLVIGDEEAVMIDSGYGAGNIREYAQGLTHKPLRNILNTHDHFDHTANNSYFECAYMSEETAKRATLPFSSFEGIDFPRDYPKKILKDGDIYPLNGRELEVFSIPDHAPGSLAFLDRKERILFSGDELGMPFAKRLNESVEAFAEYLEKLEKRRQDFDLLCAGFGVLPADIIEKYLANMNYILAGHEGKRLEEKEKEKTEVYDERIIYTRRAPHFPDIPKHDPKEQTYKRIMEYAGCRVLYDVRKVLKHS